MYDVDTFFCLLCKHPDCIDLECFSECEPSPIGYTRAVNKIPKWSVEDNIWNMALRSILPEAKFIEYHWRVRILAALMDDDDIQTDNLEMLKLSIAVKQAMKEKGLTEINSLEEG